MLEHIFLISNTILEIQRQGKELKFKEPKTKKSRRSIPIPADVVGILKAERQKHRQDILAFGPGYD